MEYCSSDSLQNKCLIFAVVRKSGDVDTLNRALAEIADNIYIKLIDDGEANNE